MRRVLSLAVALALLFPGNTSALLQMDKENESTQPPKELPPEVRPREADPWPIRLMMQPVKRGMFVRLPVIDTDPNRGVTVGVMPIIVLKDPRGNRIQQIHAPSVTYNTIFQVIPTYRYYWYPSDNSAAVFRTSISRKEDRELMGEFQDRNFLSHGLAVYGRLAYNVDGAERFFGFGPDSPKSRESDYTNKEFYYTARVGLPFFSGSGWKFNIGHHLAGHRIATGVMDTLPSTTQAFPQVAGDHWHQDSEALAFVDYDTRDNPITTTRGSYAKFSMENSQRALGSEYTFRRWVVDLREFYQSQSGVPRTTAGSLRFEQLTGSAPFYLLPQLGGKSVLRAYGTGRYIDNGLLVANVEERFTVYKIPLAGVSTEFEVAPFAGAGSVFDEPHDFSVRYVRPVLGTALRAIARPQVVGSVDFGVGREGLATFIDINYSF